MTRLALSLVLLSAATAGAGTPPLVGTWTIVAADVIQPVGTRARDYGAEPRGLVFFAADGRYAFQLYRSDRTRFASGDRAKGTPDEYRDASLGMSTHFGTYAVDVAAGTITFAIHGASFPNWEGAKRVSPFTLEGDVLTWRVPPRPDGSIPITSLKRVR
jgi:hypothetical protein